MGPTESREERLFMAALAGTRDGAIKTERARISREIVLVNSSIKDLVRSLPTDTGMHYISKQLRRRLLEECDRLERALGGDE